MGIQSINFASFKAAGGGGGYTVLDSDAQAFITAASISDDTQKQAVDELVLDLKAASLWTKMYAVYPFVGGSSTTHSYNLKATGSHQITWNGTVTHNSSGITPNGTTGYGDTNLQPSSIMSANDAHVSIYCRTNSQSSAISMGSRNSSTTNLNFTLRNLSNALDGNMWDSTNGRLQPTVTDSRGHFILTRRSSTSVEAYRNGSSLATGTNASTSGPSTNDFFIGAWNFDGSASNHSSRNYAFVSIGTALSDTEAADLYTCVQDYQTFLSRNV
jgi:hypothetical protein